MPGYTDWRKRQEEEESYRALQELLAQGPTSNTYDPETGAYHFTRGNRAADAAAVAPMGSVPGPGMSDEEADDEQDELDQNALYEHHQAERAREDARLGAPVPLQIPPQETGDVLDQRDPFGPRQLPPIEQLEQTPAPYTASGTLSQHLETVRKFEPRSYPAAPDTAKSITPEVSKGKEPDLYGHDTETGFNPQEVMRAAAAAYDQETARREPQNQYDQAASGRELTGNGPYNQLTEYRLGQTKERLTPEQQAELEDKGLVFDDPAVQSTLTPDKLPNPYGQDERGRWEDEFLRRHTPVSDDDVHSGFVLQALAGGQQNGLKYRESLMKQQHQNDEGLYEARMRDKGESRIPKELAVAIAGTGAVSPEEAATLTYNSPLVQAYPNGMYAMGLNTQRMDRMQQQFNLGILGQQARQNRDLEAKQGESERRQQTQLEIAKMYAQRKQQMQGLAPEQQRNLFAAGVYKETQGAISMEAAAAAWDGDYSGIPEESRADVQASVAMTKPFTDVVSNRPLGPGVRAPEIKLPFDIRKVEETVLARGRNDVKFSLTQRDHMTEVGMQLSQAMHAWQEMSEQGKRAMAKFGAIGPGEEFNKAFTNPHDRALATSVWGVLNEMIQKRSGVAVNNNEWGRMAKEIGLGQGVWDPFNSYEGIERYLNHAAERFEARYNLFSNTLKWE